MYKAYSFDMWYVASSSGPLQFWFKLLNMYAVYIKKEVAHALGASVVMHLLLSLMNSFSKTEAAIFPCRLYFLEDYHFTSLLA